MKNVFLCLALICGTLVCGCGRIALSSVDTSRGRLQKVAQHTPPSDIVQADREGRVAAAVGANAPLVFAMVGVFDADGNVIDGTSTSAFVRFALPGGAKPALRSVYLDFQDRPHRFEGAVKYTSGVGMSLNFKDASLASIAYAVPLAIGRMPTPQTAVAMGTRAGLIGGKFVVIYESQPRGPELIVGEWIVDDAGDSFQHIGATRVFGALNGKVVGDPQSDPSSEPTLAPSTLPLPSDEPTIP